jgi:hypothetical protein
MRCKAYDLKILSFSEITLQQYFVQNIYIALIADAGKGGGGSTKLTTNKLQYSPSVSLLGLPFSEKKLFRGPRHRENFLFIPSEFRHKWLARLPAAS